MPEQWRIGHNCGDKNAKVRIGAVAARQFGRISCWQLARLGVSRQSISRWVQQGYLHPTTLSGVYAVGHEAPSVEADLAAAVLYAGPDAMLSHGTAAWWWGLIDNRPSTTHVSTPRRCRSRRGIKVHERRECPRARHEGLPVTTVAQTLLDFASRASVNRVRTALANAEYHELLDVDEVHALLGHGRSGSTRLRTALERHEPRLAYARSPVEVAFFELCERFGLPLPEVNVRLSGWTVDFFWRKQGVVVEVDPYGNHHTPAQIDRDRRKDLDLRAAGLTVTRYSRDQVEQAPDAIAADVVATLSGRRAASARSPAGS
jgi:predicted transcriptional regulator of viral defense system